MVVDKMAVRIDPERGAVEGMTTSVHGPLDGAQNNLDVADGCRGADRFQMAMGWHDRRVDIPGVNHFLPRIVERGAVGSGEPDRVSREAGLREDHEFRAGLGSGMDMPNDSL
jgi:hypothetical protein